MTLKNLADRLYPAVEKNFVGGECKIFLSATDMKVRAIVKNASANTLAEAWKIALEDLQKTLSAEKIEPIILRADWVTSSEKMTWANFNKLIERTRRNYFRRGLALDGDYKIAFTEMEMNGNSMLYQGGKEGKAKCVFRQNFSDKYCNRRFGCDFPTPQDTDIVEVFDTQGAFVNADENPEIITGTGIYAGRRNTSPIDADLFMKLAKTGANYLVKQIQPSGKFIYGYHTFFHLSINTYNTLRHISSAFAMLDVYGAYKKMPPMKLGKAIKNAVEYAANHYIKHRTLADGTRAAYYFDDVSNEIKLGGLGVSLLAFAKYSELMHTKKYLPLMKELANGILSMQNPDGSFVHVLNSNDFSIKEPFRIVYYDGEAVFGMLRLYSITKDEKLLQASELAFTRFIKTDHWRNHDHWLSYAINELTLYKPEAKYFEFGINNFLDFLPFIYHRDTQFPTLLELMMAADTMLERMKNMPEMAELLARVDLNDFYASLEKRAENLLSGHFWPELAMYFQNPAAIVGSFFIRHHAFRVRIDDVEHFLSGFVAYCRYLERRKNMPAPVPSQKLLQSKAEGTGLFNIDTTAEKKIAEPVATVEKKIAEPVATVEKKIPEPVAIAEKKVPEPVETVEINPDIIPVEQKMTDSILHTFELLGIKLPNKIAAGTVGKPSDYLGKNFSLTEKMQEDLMRAAKWSKEEFQKNYDMFKGDFDLQRSMDRNETDLNIYFCDWFFHSRRNGYHARDYFDYEFYNKPHEIQKTFVGGVYRRKNNSIGNDHASLKMLRHKDICNGIFRDFIHRRWLNTMTCDFSDFKIFVSKYPRFFAKQYIGGHGEGVEVIQTDENSNLEEIFNRLKTSEMIVEQPIEQHEIMKEFCPDTINTVRIITFLDEHNFVNIIVSSGRFGRVGTCVDNYSSGGYSVVIDPETGIIVSDGINKFHERAEKHPDTGKVFRGFQYPFWDKICKTVIKMAKMVPGVRHVGWDIAINSKDKIVLVEANEYPGTITFQSADSVGKIKFYKPIISRYEEYKKAQMKFLGYKINNIRNPFTMYEKPPADMNLATKLAMSKLVADCESLLDVGCRKAQRAKKLCPANVKYYAVNNRKIDDEVFVCNFNEEFPEIKVDTCLCVMTAECVEKIVGFLKNVCGAARKQILIVSRPADKERSPRFRWDNQLMTDFTEEFLIENIEQENFKLQSATPLKEKSSLYLYDFRRVGEEKISEPVEVVEDSEIIEEKNIYGIPDCIMKACKFFKYKFPEKGLSDGEHKPSEYFGGDFEISIEWLSKLQKASKLNQQKFSEQYGLFAQYYISQEYLKPNETDLHVYFYDWVVNERPKGASLVDYFDFEFYRQPLSERKKFRLQGDRKDTMSICNDEYFRKFLNNKAATNRIFSRFVHRDWLNTKVCSFSEFKNFVAKHPTFFIKPVVGSLGRNAEIVHTDENTKLKKMFKQLRENIFIVEQVIDQHEIMKEFCPDTLNTLRINTLVDIHNEVHILAVSGRFGRVGTFVDNYSSGGFTVTVDPMSGKIISDGVDKAHQHSKKHPDTGKVFRGFQYPFWDKIRDTVKQMAIFMPGVRHIGWDIAVDSNENIVLVEANCNPDVHVQQSADLTGRLYLYEDFLEEMKNYKAEAIKYLGYRINFVKNFYNLYEANSDYKIGVETAMKKLIEDCTSVIDLGCRKDKLIKSLCAKNIKYYPVDFKDHEDEEIIVSDFNCGEFPEIKADTCICALTAEYVVRLPQFLKNICNATQKQILMVCRPIEKETEYNKRWKNPFLVDFTEEFLINTFAANNFKLKSATPLAKRPSVVVYDFRAENL